MSKVKNEFKKCMLIITFVLILVFALKLSAISTVMAQSPFSFVIKIVAQNGSNQEGIATLTDIGNGQTKVEVVITPSSEGLRQPAHIHEGTCDNLEAAVSFPLTEVKAGSSTTIITVSISELLAKPYAINVHKSFPEIGTYVACGNIASTAPPKQTPNGMGNSGRGGASYATRKPNPLLPEVIVLFVVTNFSIVLFIYRRHYKNRLK